MKQRSQLSRGIFYKSDKKSLRFFYNQKLSEMSLFQRRQKTEKINQLLLNLPFWKKARFISVYKAFKQEPCLSSFCSGWKDKICFPVIKEDKLVFYTNKLGQWKKNKFNMLEPISDEKNKAQLKDISVFLIPGMAFDRQGGRLGRGYAYYDKTLSSIKRKNTPNIQKSWNKQALFIGVAFIEQVTETALPLSQYDILMDCLITDQFILWPLNSRKRGK